MCSQAAACGGVQATPRAVLRQQRVSAYVRQLMARPSMQGQRVDPFKPLGAVARPRHEVIEHVAARHVLPAAIRYKV